MLCSVENDRHSKNGHRMFRVECAQRHPGQSKVFVESETADDRVSSVRTFQKEEAAPGVCWLLANAGRNQPTWFQAVAGVEEQREQV